MSGSVLETQLRGLSLIPTREQRADYEVLILDARPLLRGLRERVRIVLLHDTDQISTSDAARGLLVRTCGFADTTPVVMLAKQRLASLAFAPFPYCLVSSTLLSDGLREGGPDFLRRFLVAHIPLPYMNPYDSKTPVAEDMFFGRHDNVADLLRESDNFVIFGPRRGGKTSLAKAVERTLRADSDFRVALGVRIGDARYFYSVAYVDTQALIHPDDLWVAILTSMGLEARDYLRNTIWPKLDVTTRSVIGKSPFEILQTLLSAKYRKAVIMLDEVDDFLLRDSQAKYPVCGKLRVLADDPAAHTRILLFGYQTLHALSRRHDFPLHGRFLPMKVANLEYDAVERLICTPLRELDFTLEDVPEIVSQVNVATGAMPHLIQHLFHELVRACATTGDRVITPRLMAAFVERRRTELIEQVYDGFNALTDPLPRLIAYIGVGVQPLTFLDVLDILRSRYHLDITDQQAKTALDCLFLHNVFHMTDDPDEYVFASKLLHDRLRGLVTSDKGRVLLDSLRRQVKARYGGADDVPPP